jgi:hypothetical protein
VVAEEKSLVKANIAEDHISVRIMFPRIPAGSRSMNLRVDELTELIEELSRVRAAMVASKQS